MLKKNKERLPGYEMLKIRNLQVFSSWRRHRLIYGHALIGKKIVFLLYN
jgi:hypothetical protein